VLDDKERNRLVHTIIILANGLVFSIFSAFHVFGNMKGWLNMGYTLKALPTTQ